MTSSELRVSRDKEVGPPLPGTVTSEWPVWSKDVVPATDAEEFAGLLPPHRTPRRGWFHASFLLCVVIPTALAAVYFFKLQTPQFTSGFRFNVSEVSTATPGGGAPSSSSGSSALTASLSAITGGGSAISGGGSKNYMVTDYIKSDQAVRDLVTTTDLRKIYSRPGVDRLSGLSKNASFEELVDFWRRMVSADYDPVTGIAWVEVRAFLPDDAYKTATQLVALAEKQVNEIEARANRGVVEAADTEVARTRTQLTAVRKALREFRNKQGIIDPTQSIVPANISQVSALQSSLIQLKTQFASTKQLAPNSPFTRSLASQIKAAESELQRVKNEVAKSRTGEQVLSDVITQYEALNFDLQYQQSMLMSAMQAREQAYANAHAQHIFMTPYVRPVMPTSATYPNSYLATFYFGLAALGAWITLMLVRAGISDHS